MKVNIEFKVNQYDLINCKPLENKGHFSALNKTGPYLIFFFFFNKTSMLI